MKLLKFAAIDIGTNAIRLLFTNVTEEAGVATFKKSSLIRVPIRLGADVFTNGQISEIKKEKLINSLLAFSHLIDVHDVVSYRACATSAMREAQNGPEIVKVIKDKTGIDIEIIDGKTEAEIIYSNKIAELTHPNENYLYVDVGGGSTEVTLFRNNEVQMSHSFNIGTIRMLNQKAKEEEFEHLKQWLIDLNNKKEDIKIIGSGGNINKLHKMSSKKYMKPLSYKELKDLYKYIKAYSYEDRIRILGLNPDRADVIIPASKLFLKIMKWSDAKHILVPKFGVADGLVRQLYKDFSEKN